MNINQLRIEGSYEVTSSVIKDERGHFAETFRQDLLESVIGHKFLLRQMNTSVSQKGVVRGIHFADIPKGQAKYVTVPLGKILDYVIDLRVGSPTFGEWTSIEISSSKRNAVYISEGLGHAFLSLEDDTVVNYLVSDFYNPLRERAICPLDSDINLIFPFPAEDLLLSEKDNSALSFRDSISKQLLPSLSEVNVYLNTLKGEGEK